MSGPIANRPGLYLDETTHRWTHVPREEMDVLDAFHNTTRRRMASDRNAVLDAHDQGHVEFARPGQSGPGRMYQAVLPDPSRRGKWKLQQYDETGPYGHEVFDTQAEALHELGDRGYTEPTPGAMDRLAQTDTWRRGVAVAHVKQRMGFVHRINTSEQHRKIRLPIEGHMARHGPEATANLMMEHLPALRRGELPEAFLRSRVLFVRRLA